MKVTQETMIRLSIGSQNKPLSSSQKDNDGFIKLMNDIFNINNEELQKVKQTLNNEQGE